MKLRRQTRKEHLNEIITGISSKLLDGSYTPTEILFINECIKHNSGEYLDRELRKTKVTEHKIKKDAKELERVLTAINH